MAVVDDAGRSISFQLQIFMEGSGNFAIMSVRFRIFQRSGRKLMNKAITIHFDFKPACYECLLYPFVARYNSGIQ